MNSEEALQFINLLLEQKKKEILNKLEEDIFWGIWEDKSYAEINVNINYSYQHIRKAGSDLCKKIQECLEIRVDKRNFKNSIKRRYQQYLAKDWCPLITYSEEETLSEKQESKKISFLQGDQKLNPFIPQQGKVDDPKRFFNRDREIQRIFEIINSSSSVALIGEEGIGKSSLLWAICHHAEIYLHTRRLSVFLDLNNGIHSEDEFYSALCDEIGIPECKGYRLSRNLKGCRILLAIDNVGKLTGERFTRQVRDQLRGLAEGSEAPLRLILAASESLNNLFDDSQDEGKTSPLAGICQEEEVKLWDELTIRAFIEARLATTSVRFTEEDINQLVQQSGGHPRRLVQLCYQTYAQYRESME